MDEENSLTFYKLTLIVWRKFLKLSFFLVMDKENSQYFIKLKELVIF